jgi:hypothetical protein
MKVHPIIFFACFICVALLTACGKKSEPITMSEVNSALVTIKVAEPKKEHETHGDENESEHRESGVHVHGAVSMSLVLESSLLNIAMSIPGMDAVGFEHPAVSADEQAMFKKALTHLQNPDALFIFPKSAECKLVGGTVETALLDKNVTLGAHMDVDIHYQWGCKRPDKLTQLSVQLFSYFVHLQKIQANWVSHNKQGAAQLTKEITVLSIE